MIIIIILITKQPNKMQKIKVLKIRLTSDNQEFNLMDFFDLTKEKSVSIRDKHLTLTEDEIGKFWSVIIFYESTTITTIKPAFFPFTGNSTWNEAQRIVLEKLEDYAKLQIKGTHKGWTHFAKVMKLREIAWRFETLNNPNDLREITGFNDSKVKLHGEAIMSIINNYKKHRDSLSTENVNV